MKKTLLLFVIAVCTTQLFSQTLPQGVPDFTDLNASYVWKGYNTSSNFDNLLNINTYSSGIRNNSHTVINTPGFDDNAFIDSSNSRYYLNQLPVWDGDTLNAVVRLGEPSSPFTREYYGAGILYSFIPDSSSSLLNIYLALVMELPHTDYMHNPTYQIRILDQNNELIDSTSYFLLNTGYDRNTGSLFPNPLSKTHSVQWNMCTEDYISILWVDWSSVVFDLGNYIGREVRLEILATGCILGAHYGYGYYTFKGMSRSIDTKESTEEEIVLKAPPGFISYDWYDQNGIPLSSGQSNIYRAARDTNINDIQCNMVSRTGKTVTLNIKDFHYEIENDFEYEQSDAYCRKNIHFDNTGKIRTMGINSHDMPLEIAEWNFGDGSPVTEDIETSHVYEEAGDYEVTCTLFSPDRVFKKAVTKTVTVREAEGTIPADPEEILGESNVVPQQTYIYYIEEVPDALTYEWTLTGENWQLSESDSNRIEITITGTGNAVLAVKAVNLCGSSREISKDIQASVTGLGVNKTESVSIYPNPIKNKVTVSIPDHRYQHASIRISDIMGKEIIGQHIKGSTTILDLSNLKSGIYFLQILDDQHITGTYKIIKE